MRSSAPPTSHEPGDVVLLSPACASFDAYAELRRAWRRLRRRGACLHRGAAEAALDDRDHAARRARPSRSARRRARATRADVAVALPRPPTYVVLCATVAVLNVVGLVMILSASSVAALSNYGSSWYFFNRQLAWAFCGAIAFVVAARVDYHAVAPHRAVRARS